MSASVAGSSTTPAPDSSLTYDASMVAGLVQIERVNRKIYRTRDEARADVFDYVERFYNPRRRHSTLGYVSPADFERAASST